MNRFHYVICFGVSLIQFGCIESEYTKADLNGHWHLYHIEDTNRQIYYELEIENDTTAFVEGINTIEQVNIESREYRRNIFEFQGKKYMILWIDGSYEEFEYQIINEELRLKPVQGMNLDRFIGRRLIKEKCNWLSDLYSTNKVFVELPMNESDPIYKRGNDKSRIMEVFMGKNKSTGIYQIEIGNRLVKNSEIPIEFEKFQFKVRKEYWNDLELQVHIDANFPREDQEAVLSELKRLPFKRTNQVKRGTEKEVVLIPLF